MDFHRSTVGLQFLQCLGMNGLVVYGEKDYFMMP